MNQDYDHLQRAAKDHLWMHFTRHSAYDTADVPVIVRGEGPYLSLIHISEPTRPY